MCCTVIGNESNLLFGASRSQRAPTVEELYSNVATDTCAREEHDEHLVLHAATNLLEIGNPMLEEETASNFEFGFRQYAGNFTGEFSAYYNQIDNYIFLDLTGEEFEEQPLALYMQRDARFSGIEGEVSFNVMEGEDSSLSLGVFGDMVNAEFDSGGYVPRIPASKIGAELRWFGDSWSVHLHATRVTSRKMWLNSSCPPTVIPCFRSTPTTISTWAGTAALKYSCAAKICSMRKSAITCPC